MRPLSFLSGLTIGTLIMGSVVSAWTGPTQTAPAGNVLAPINAGPTAQVKNGSLGVNSLAVYGNTILNGTNLYLNFGTTAGSGGYGIRDNSGTLEFKSTGGSWNTLTTAITNVLGIGAVTQIKFADGTTQTSAVSGYTGTMQNPVSSTVTPNPSLALSGTFAVTYTQTATIQNGLVKSVANTSGRATMSEPRCAGRYCTAQWPGGNYNARAICTSSGYVYVSNASIFTPGAYGNWDSTQGKFAPGDPSCTGSCSRVSSVTCSF